MRGGRVALLELDHDLSIRGADRPGSVVSHIDAANRQSYVVHRQVELLGRDGLPDRAFHPGKQPTRLFQSGAGRRANVQTKRACINRREEVLADQRTKANVSDKEGAKAEDHRFRRR